jgi:predicted RNA-binding Zn-ribbon protein involved in translation (DUF1610 family)
LTICSTISSETINYPSGLLDIVVWRKKGEATKKRKVGTYHCPKCNSTKIEHEYALSPYLILGISLLYHCHECGYKGMVVYNYYEGELDEDAVVQEDTPGSVGPS